MELSRAEKLKRTRIENIMKHNPGMSLAEAELKRQQELVEHGRRGGQATFEGKGFAGMSPEKRREAGRRGGLARSSGRKGGQISRRGSAKKGVNNDNPN